MEPKNNDPPPPDDELGTYYRLSTVNKWLFDLSVEEGDRVATILDKTTEQPNDESFLTFTDRYGSEVRVKVSHVEVFYFSDPRIRAAEKEAERKESEWRKAHRGWDDGN